MDSICLVTNAGSGDLSVLSVAADGSLELRVRVETGATPRSVAERDGLVVVMNTGEPSLVSLRLSADGIEPVEGGEQALARTPTRRRSDLVPTDQWSWSPRAVPSLTSPHKLMASGDGC